MPHVYTHHTHITTPPHYIPHTSYTNTHALHKHPHISHTPTHLYTPPTHVPLHTCTPHPLHTSSRPYKHTCPYTTPAHHAQIHTFYTHHPRTAHTRIYTHARRVRMLCYLVLGARPHTLLSAQTCFLPALSVLSLGSSFQVPWLEVPSALVKISCLSLPMPGLTSAPSLHRNSLQASVSRACFLPLLWA